MNPNNSSGKKPTYDDLGASHQKEEVHSALKNIDKGLYPNAFCKIIPDIALDPSYCSIVHADGAGTKSSIAYMMYKESKNLDYFKSIAQDSVVMNTDDIICVGLGKSYYLSNTIGRNKKLISGEIIAAVIEGYEDFLKKLRSYDFPIYSSGGETADLGDILRTIVIDSTIFTRIPRKNIIDTKKICNGDVIVGLASYGKSRYENQYNSGIGSNGLTLARHGTLDHSYYNKYPECVAPELDENIAFFGKYHLNDNLPTTPLTIGEGLLSPTRTYIPILNSLISNYFNEFHALFHNTGGGQTKCLRFGSNFHYIKDDFLPIPPMFNIIQESSEVDWKEMYHVFNMGHRMEIICSESFALDILIPKANKLNVDAKIVGHVEKNSLSRKNRLTIQSSVTNFTVNQS